MTKKRKEKYDPTKQPNFKKRKNNPDATIIFESGYVVMPNELSLYNLLNYSTDQSLRVTPLTMDIYRRLKQHRNNDEDSPMMGKAWISMERLGIELGINRKTVSKHLHVLENVGLIYIKRFYRGGRKHCSFTFGQVMEEAEFKKTYPEVIAEYERKMKDSEKVSDVEPWFNPENIVKEDE